ncbi:hypothetical protein [Leptospira sp. GIMC2001]|uniref:hypothetical protein n=1 Tax=Leptospira sp. GIMC2001 TaxID=1513297 RepID=UPI00234A1898|nr:hypothetical protein [Leptospira sp. GIMC2001]WCL47691.1 hypothetical protein O4O04_00100 [Leptospira sp. GIMC2001]
MKKITPISIQKYFNPYRRFLLSFVIGLVLLSSLGCVADTTLDSDEANSQIYSAISYKARECGNPIPSQYLFVVSEKVPQRNIDLCTIAILRTECPLNSFPIACVMIYLEEVREIPPGINFLDFIDAKL